MNKEITFGSLFAGIGGIDLGFERAGFTCKWQVEIDDYANKVLEKHWPNVHRERDINECGKENLESVDVIAGGFPCQDLSYAGRGAGLDGERSGLFFETVRLVCELRPRLIMLENVAALLTRGLDRVCGTLAAVGYDAEWHCIPAAALGAPHIRDRIFIIGINTDPPKSCHDESENVVKIGTKEQIQFGRMGSETNVPERRRNSEIVLDNADSSRRGESDEEMEERPSEQFDSASSNAGEIPDPISKPAWNQGGKACGQRREPARTLQPKTLRQRDGETMPERIKPICSNVPDPDREDSQRRIPNGEFNKKGREKPSSRFITQCSVKRERDGNSEGTIKPELGRIINGISGGMDRDLNFWKNGDWEKGVPRVTVKSPNRINRLKGLGNAVVPQVAEFIARQIMENYFNGKEANSDASL